MSPFRIGATVYLLESRRFIHEAIILDRRYDIFTIKFTDTGGAIRVRRNRLFACKEDAMNFIDTNEKEQTNQFYP